MNISRTYRTPKGTELLVINLRGKEYLEVKYRLVWFREERPNWSIETEFISLTDSAACAKASIKDETGRVIATAHKSEDKKSFPDFIEKCETGATGRALALCGYGTQFCADELDEGTRIVDAPAFDAKPSSQAHPQQKPAPAKQNGVAGDFVISRAKKDWEGLTIKQVVNKIGLPQFQKDVAWWHDSSSRGNTPEIKHLKANCERYSKLLAEAAHGKPEQRN